MVYKNFLIYKLKECATDNYNFVARELEESGHVRKFIGNVHSDDYDENLAITEIKELIDRHVA